jgi:hypothetical protein
MNVSKGPFRGLLHFSNSSMSNQAVLKGQTSASRKLWNRTVLWMRWAARRWLLFVCWCARKHGCHTFRIDVEGQEYQRLVAWVSPLVHESVWFIDQGTWSPCFRLTVDRVRSGARNNIVQSRS